MGTVRHPLRWIAPIGYIASINGMLVLVGLSTEFDPESTGMFDGGFTVLGLCALAAFVAGIAECIVLFARKADGRLAFARRAMLLVKLGLVPFFCLGGLIMALLLVLSLHPVMAMLGWVSLPFAAATGWIVLMGGSAYSIAYAAGLRGDRRISTGECAVHIIAQTMFFADVIDMIALFFRGRALERRVGAASLQTIPPGYPAAPAPAQPATPSEPGHPGMHQAPGYPAAPQVPGRPAAPVVPDSSAYNAPDQGKDLP